MSTILLRRASTFKDGGRNYQVFVDGRHVTDVPHGGESRIKVAPGAHRIELKIDWCSSPEVRIVVAEGEECLMDCGNNVGGSFFGVFVYTTVKRAEYLWLEPVRESNRLAAARKA